MTGQETLIYIDEKDVVNASITAKNFTKEDIRNRVYYNSLGAQLVKKFLASENVDVSNLYNIHNIQKILEELDISDLMLQNIHIDVRVVFNENYIFIPKSHFNYEILPDIYLVLLMSSDKKYMKFLGFFEPKLINKNNQNKDFYFIEKEKLTSPINLKEFISKFDGNTTQELAINDIEKADMMMLSMVDHDITEEEKKELLKNLCKSAQLRDRFIEFENFELLAFSAQNSPDIVIPENNNPRTLDFAASATAIALQEFNETHPDEFNASEISTGFTNSDRELPGLVATSETSDNELDLMSLSEELDETTSYDDISTIEEVSKTLDAIEPVETTEEISETVENLDNEITDNSAGTIEDFAIIEEETSEEDDLLNAEFDKTFNETETETDNFEIIEEIQETDSNTSSETILAQESEVINFDEMEIVNTTQNSNDDYEHETISLDEMLEVENTTSVNVQDTLTETVDINNIEEVEIPPTINHDVTQETIEIDSIPLDNETFTSESSLTEPTIELQSFDNLNIEPPATTEIREESIETIEPTMEKIEIPSFSELTEDSSQPEDKVSEDPFAQIKCEGLLTEVFNKELAPETSYEEEISTLDSLNEDMQETTTEPEKISFSDFKNATEEDPDRIILPEEVIVSDEDKELDEMLNLEDFTTIEATQAEETSTNEPEYNSTSTDFSELTNDETSNKISAEVNTEEPTSSTSDQNEETIADLDLGVNDIGKTCLIGGVEHEETPELSTGELISQIDDLLNSEENENNETDTDTKNSDEIELEGIKIPDTIQDADEFDSPEIESVIEKDEITNKQGDDDDKLEVLFSSTLGNNDDSEKIEDDMLGEEEIEEYETEDETNSGNNKKNLIIIGTALVALLAASAGGFFWWKNNNELADLMSPNPIENDTTNLPNNEPDIAANAPDSSNLIADTKPVEKPAPQKPAATVDNTAKQAQPKPAEKVAQKPATPTKPAVKQPAKPAATTASKPTITGKPIEYISVRSLSWEVPDYLSYSDGVKKYLQAAGKSIRLTLSSDLLLATEYAYSNQIKVAILLEKDGTVKGAQIIKSSGSNQINEIVLRTVKDTLKVVKPASGEIPTDNFKLGLIINI